MQDRESDGRVCAACGHRNRGGRKFCAECGAPLALACPSCGSPNEPGERFCGECGSELGLHAAAGGREPATQGVERRLVSVLFADLVGHTSRSEQHDVEEVRELLARYFEVARTVVARYGGVVEKFIGDAVMAVWGTPTAREDDAERAVRAALELVTAVATLEGGERALSARAAVLTGEAAVTLGARGQGMVAGDLVNTASRVQALAEPGMVLVGEATRRASEASIAYANAGLHELKGRSEPVPLWQALRVVAGRQGGLKPDALEPPFVGRDRELRVLKELFHASADEGRAHLVSIIGIAGIGKSRLAWELHKYLDGVAQTVLWHRGRSLAYGEGVSYWALAEMVRMRAGIAEGEDAASAEPKLREALELHVADPDEREWIAARLGQLLGLDERGAGERADLFAGWRLFLEHLADAAPVVLVFEDMQWADAALLEFLAYLLDWSRSHPLFVVALARPELGERHPRWASDIRNATTLSLEPLASEAMEQLLEGFVPGLPDDLRRQVLARAEGVPLYAVETVRMLLDRGLLEQHGAQYRPTGAIDLLEVPETLHALVASRLDSLAAEERRLLQDASVLGKTFTRSAVASLGSLSSAELEPLLGSLVRKEILALQADPRSPERGQYGFLQDLLRQVAYETMARSDRKLRHLAAARHIEEEWKDGEHEIAEIVASHYLTALELDPDADDADEITARAKTTLIKAGERAASLGANQTAQRYFEQSLELADGGLERAELHERAGGAAMLAAEAEPARAHFEQAIAAFGDMGLAHRAARVTARLGVMTWLHEGDVERAIADMEQALSVLSADDRDPDVANLAAQLARPLFFAGRVDEAMARNELALRIGEALQAPEVLSHGLSTKGVILTSKGRYEEGGLLLRRALELALEHDLADAALRTYNNVLFIEAYADRHLQALDLARAGLELARRVGSREAELSLSGWMAGLLVTVGEWDEALAVAEAVRREGDRPSRVDREWVSFSVIPVFVDRGDMQEAERRLRDAREGTDWNEVQARAVFRAMEAAVLLGKHEAGAALAAARDALGARAALGMGHDAVRGGLAAAFEAAFALHDEASIEELFGVIEALPPADLAPSVRALGARFGARRGAMRGDGETASAGFTAAADIYEQTGRPLELAVVQLEHAEWLADEGRHEEAAPLLSEARATFERLRAAPWVERADVLRAALREPAAVEG